MLIITVAERRSVAMSEEPAALITRVEVEAMLKREQNKAFVSNFSLDFKPFYLFKVATRPYPIGYMSW